MDKLFELKTKYTLNEHIKYNFAIALRSKELMITGIILLITFVCAIIARMFLVIVFAILFPILYVLIIYMTAKKNYLSNKAAQDAEIIVEFYQDYMIQKTELGSYKVEHDKIARIIETKTHFYVMISKNQGVILPKVDMSDEMQQYVRNILIDK